MGGIDLQTIGIQVANYRKQIAQLKDRITDLEIERDGLKLVIEDILLSPSTHEYYSDDTGNPHPMNDN